MITIREYIDPDGRSPCAFNKSRAYRGGMHWKKVKGKQYLFRSLDRFKLEPKSALIAEDRQVGSGDDLMAAEIKNLQWLISAPKFDQVVIGEDGFPAVMVVPDPRAFAVHRLWLSSQKDREAVKKKRDRSQALAVCKRIKFL